MMKRLCAARDLIAKGWCQKTLARNSDGNPVDPQSADAVQFCIHGAIDRACTGTYDLDETQEVAHHLATAGALHDLAEWNDAAARRQQDVLSLFDHAIERASQLAGTGYGHNPNP